MPKQREKVGAIIKIPIKDSYYVYAQILQRGLYCFFDYKSIDSINDLDILKKASVLFIVCVYPRMVNNGEWKIIGDMPIRDDLRTIPNMYIQDMITKEISLYNPMTGDIIPSTKQQVVDLECCAVWDKEHIEDRIISYYENQQCIWLEILKVK